MSSTKDIPPDFPRGVPIASLTGAQPKLAVRADSESGAYYLGLSADELAERFEICDDLANQLVAKCQRNRGTKYATMTEEKILAGMLKTLLTKNWGSEDEMRWVIRRTAVLLGWPVPIAARFPHLPERTET